MSRSLFRIGDVIADGLEDAPNPKPTASDKARFGQLASLYTAFSSTFATHLIEICVASGATSLADPFSGTGTLAEAARPFPISLTLGDISPFAALAGLFRSASQSELSDSICVLEDIANRASGGDEQTFYDAVISGVTDRQSVDFRSMLESPSVIEHRRAAIMSFVASLSRLRLHKKLTGSNPTWVKRQTEAGSAEEARSALRETIIAARSYVDTLPPLANGFVSASHWRALSETPSAHPLFDAIITSPPYPNRTDYIRHYLPASELLLHSAGEDERKIRSDQIGTPLIRAQLPGDQLPESARQIIEQVRTHGSYASESYYYKGFAYYFADMAQAMAKMARIVRADGMIALVVQDTFYKDVHIPTADILTDIGEMAGLKLKARRDWDVKQRLSHMSPHSRNRPTRHSLSESTIVFSK